jgi:tRNA(Ile)-lysidine synthase
MLKTRVVKSDCIPKQGQIVIGFSGGPDSLCLLHLLASLRTEYDFTLHAVHVNHSLRASGAEDDAAYAQKMCALLEVPFSLSVVDVATEAKKLGQTIEEAGRVVRYRIFTEVATEIACANSRKEVRIAVGHTMDDQAETVLMRIIRGTGTDGLSGMDVRRSDESGFEIIRPLITTERREIESYCRENALEPKVDPSNVDQRYLRSRIRAELLPLLKAEYNEGVRDNLIRLATAAAQDRDFFAEETAQMIHEAVVFDTDESGHPVSASMVLKSLNSLHSAFCHRVIRGVFRQLGLKQDISSVHITGALSLAHKGVGGKIAEFPHGYRFRIAQGKAIFERSPIA